MSIIFPFAHISMLEEMPYPGSGSFYAGASVIQCLTEITSHR